MYSEQSRSYELGLSPKGVDPEQLRSLGKEAAMLFGEGGVNLTDAVVDVLRDESGFSPEHVRRVSEFANNYAFEREFRKSAADHRVINFDGGPADSSRVLQELRSGSDSGMTITKKASEAPRRYIPGEDGLRFRQEFLEKTAEAKADYPYLNPNRELFELREKVKTARDQIGSQMMGARVAYDDAVEEMCKVARDLVIGGCSPAEVARAYTIRSPHPNFTKLALKLVSQRVRDVPAVPMSKEAAERSFNPRHPLCTTFDQFVKCASEMFTLSAASEKLSQEFSHVDRRVKDVIKQSV